MCASAYVGMSRAYAYTCFHFGDELLPLLLLVLASGASGRRRSTPFSLLPCCENSLEDMAARWREVMSALQSVPHTRCKISSTLTVAAATPDRALSRRLIERQIAVGPRFDGRRLKRIRVSWRERGSAVARPVLMDFQIRIITPTARK